MPSPKNISGFLKFLQVSKIFQKCLNFLVIFGVQKSETKLVERSRTIETNQNKLSTETVQNI